jgi:hypothetical protein
VFSVQAQAAEKGMRQVSRRTPIIPPTQRLCEKFVVRPSGGSLYLYLRRITNFRLKAGLQTLHFHTVSQLVVRSYAAYTKEAAASRPNPTNAYTTDFFNCLRLPIEMRKA